MSVINLPLNNEYLNEFNPTLFRREDDLLNVFKDTPSIHQYDENFNLRFDYDKNDLFGMRKIDDICFENIQHFSHLKDFDSINGANEAVNTPSTNRESERKGEQSKVKDDNITTPSCIANEDVNSTSEFVTKQSKGNFTNFQNTLSAGQSSCSSKPVTSPTQNQQSDE